jgi:hypothetical protein
MSGENPVESASDSHNPPHFLPDYAERNNQHALDRINTLSQTKHAGDKYQTLYQLCNWAREHGLRFNLNETQVDGGIFMFRDRNHNNLIMYVHEHKLYLYSATIQAQPIEIQTVPQGQTLIQRVFPDMMQNDSVNPPTQHMQTEILTNFHNRILNLEERLAGGGVTLEG